MSSSLVNVGSPTHTPTPRVPTRACRYMGVLFDYHELWDVVESGVSALADNATEAQRVTHRDKKKKDKKALYLIHQGMTRRLSR